MGFFFFFGFLLVLPLQRIWRRVVVVVVVVVSLLLLHWNHRFIFSIKGKISRKGWSHHQKVQTEPLEPLSWKTCWVFSESASREVSISLFVTSVVAILMLSSRWGSRYFFSRGLRLWSCGFDLILCPWTSSALNSCDFSHFGWFLAWSGKPSLNFMRKGMLNSNWHWAMQI